MKNFFVLVIVCLSGLAFAAGHNPSAVIMPGGEKGIGFDDLGFSPQLGKVLVPGGRTGRIFFITPRTREVSVIAGLGAVADYAAGHGEGPTSVDEGQGLLFAIDRTAMKVDALDPLKGGIVASAPLASGPDYVRYVDASHEVWVTQPGNERIEIFTFASSSTPALAHAAFIPVPAGPESLVIDNARGRAYTHLWAGTTVAIDIKARAVVGTWANGCEGSRGIALDSQKGFLFAGCREGKAVVLDVHDGKVLGSLSAGTGVDVIAYNPKLGHLYVPGATSATMAIMGVSRKGSLSLLGSVPTARKAHCAAFDDLDQVWVCDPDHGQMLVIEDNFPASGH